ncbi:MAG TPA: DUF2865 domain-containing protein [Rhodoblastus sp.]|nr:DUF2865 domain-containing protein [Rhodoblastus sp.]
MRFLAGMRPAGIILALSVAASPMPRAVAQVVDCARLAQQIAAAGASGGSQKAAVAANRQQSEIARLSAHARAIGCGRPHFLFFDDRPAQCDGLNARIEGLRASVAQLQRAAYGGGGLRQQLQNQYEVYCRGQQPNFIEQLFGGRDQIVYPPAGQPDDGAVMEPQDDTPRGGSEAICVRTCDGSFFPISYSARRANLADLQEMCAAQCPAAEVKLYTRTPRDMKTAVSIDGDPYTNLENAFKYEKQVVPQCSCRKPGQSWAEALVDAEKLLGEGRKGDILVTPEKAEELSRPQQAGQANAKGKAKGGKATAFDPEAMKRLLERQKRAADQESAEERDMGARAPTAGQDSSGIDFRRD